VTASRSTLPSTFSWAEARRDGYSDRWLYDLRDRGELKAIGRGLYGWAGAPSADLDLIEIAHRAQEATMCPTSALARHGPTDTILTAIDIVLPRGQRHPRTHAPVTWHSFAIETDLEPRSRGVLCAPPSDDPWPRYNAKTAPQGTPITEPLTISVLR
jgi:hypothetical protein